MTVEVYKRQAARLVEHLSAVHKMRLKHASALETIAALYECRDWNTLLATGDAGAATGGITSQSTAGDDPVAYLFPEHKFTSPQFCDALLAQSVVIAEGFPAEKRALIDHLLYRQIQRGKGFLYVGDGNDDQLHRIAWAMSECGRADAFKVVGPGSQALGEPMNPLASVTGEGVASIAMQLLPSSDGSPGAGYYAHQAHYALVVLCNALIAAGENVTFNRLAELLMRPQQALPELESRVPLASRASLTEWLDAHRRPSKEGRNISVDSVKSTLGGLAARIAMMTQGACGAAFHPVDKGFRWTDMVRQQLGVYLNVGNHHADDSTQRLLLSSFMQGMTELGRLSQSFTVFLDVSCPTPILGELNRLAERNNFAVIQTKSDIPAVSGITASLRNGGFGRGSRVCLKNLQTDVTAYAELSEFTGWPTFVPEYAKLTPHAGNRTTGRQ